MSDIGTSQPSHRTCRPVYGRLSMQRTELWRGRFNMRRREFIALLGAATAWPLAGQAQQRERMRRVGVFMNLPADDSRAQARVGSFHQGLQQLGWVIDRNVS